MAVTATERRSLRCSSSIYGFAHYLWSAATPDENERASEGEGEDEPEDQQTDSRTKGEHHIVRQPGRTKESTWFPSLTRYLSVRALLVKTPVPIV